MCDMVAQLGAAQRVGRAGRVGIYTIDDSREPAFRVDRGSRLEAYVRKTSLPSRGVQWALL